MWKVTSNLHLEARNWCRGEELVQKASGRGTRNWCRGEDLDPKELPKSAPASPTCPYAVQLDSEPGGAYSGRTSNRIKPAEHIRFGYVSSPERRQLYDKLASVI